MFSIFKKTPVYIKFYPNKIEMTNLKTGDTLVRGAVEPFSTEHLVIAHFGKAEALCTEMKKELKLPGNLKVLMQQMVVHDEVITETEKRALRDIAELIGATTVFIITNDQPLSDDEAREFLRENS
jgi:hypothetical protein